METREPSTDKVSDQAKRVANLSPEKLAALARHIKERKGLRDRASIAPRSPSANKIPLLPSQDEMWLMDQLHPDRAIYIMAGCWPFKGIVNLIALEQALNETVRRHEILRTTFAALDGETLQVIAPVPRQTLPLVDLRGLAEKERWNQARTLSLQEKARKFDLSEELPQRPALLLLGDDNQILLHSIHHIVLDAWSWYLFISEREALYSAFTQGAPSTLTELTVQCGDIALWYREWLKGEAADAQRSYWKRQLSGCSRELELPVDQPRPARQFVGAWQKVRLAPAAVDSLRRLARDEGATLFMCLLAAVNGWLYRYTGMRDINIGTLFSTRNRPETEDLIGPFFNTLVLRTDLSGQLSFRELLRRARQVTLDAYSHSDLPFAEIEEALRSDRDWDSAPLYRVRLGLGASQPSIGSEELLDGLVGMAAQGFNQLSTLFWDTEELHSQSPKTTGQKRRSSELAVDLDYELAIHLHEVGPQIEFRMWYNSKLYAPSTAARMLRDLRSFAENCCSRPNLSIDKVPLMAPHHSHQLLVEWNDTDAAERPHDVFSELFDSQAGRTPDAVAVMTEDGQVSYGALHRRATLLAHRLKAIGVGPEALVACATGRGIDLLTAMLAAFKVGAAYLPIDPSDPPQRLQYILWHSQPAVVLTSDARLARIKEALEGFASTAHPPVTTVNMLVQTEQPATDFLLAAHPQNRAYVMFTSGSTGVPKGVMVEQAGMVNHLFCKVTDLQLTESDIVGQSASERFDISVWQLLSALLVGARVRILDDETVRSPGALLEAVEREAITILEVVPSLLVGALEEMASSGTRRVDLSSLRWLLVTGEAILPKTCAQWLSLYPYVPLLNAYGPTECSDDVAHHAIRQTPSPDIIHIPIGRPVLNTQLYVLDVMKRPLPVGVLGELHVGGAGVGRGYLSDPEKTAAVFVPDPFSQQPGGRLYATGDVGRYLPGGSLEYKGRLDYQVKVRGFRIELTEIEVMLGRHPGVQQVVVTAREDQPGEKRLVAYVVAQQPAPTTQEMIDFLRAGLPEYMVPSAFVVLEQMPITSNGKINRQALPPPDESRLLDESEWSAPESLIEKKLAEIWSETFKVKKIGIYDNFFHLGGHSIKAIKVVNRINQIFDVNLSVRHLFEEPTIGGLALLVEEAMIEKLETE